MHIPKLGNKKSWHRFFVGFFIGIIASYTVIMFMYGSMYENLFEENLLLQTELNELNELHRALIEDQEQEIEKNKQKLTIEKIEIQINNSSQLELDRLIIHQLTDMIKKEIDGIIGQEISSLVDYDHLLISTIENKHFSVDDFTYSFEIERMTIASTVKLQLKAKVS